MIVIMVMVMMVKIVTMMMMMMIKTHLLLLPFQASAHTWTQAEPGNCNQILIFILKLVFHSHSIHISFILSYSTDHQRIVFSISHFIHILIQKFVLLITDKISTCTPGLRLGKGECEGDDV